MDLPMIDQTYSQLQTESPKTIQALTVLGQKLQAASDSEIPNAREWMLDLKGVALGVQSEQKETSNLLQAIHGFLANQVATGYLPQPLYRQGVRVARQGGGMVHPLFGGGFGWTITTGAAFGIGDDLISQLF